VRVALLYADGGERQTWWISWSFFDFLLKKHVKYKIKTIRGYCRLVWRKLLLLLPWKWRQLYPPKHWCLYQSIRQHIPEDCYLRHPFFLHASGISGARVSSNGQCVDCVHISVSNLLDSINVSVCCFVLLSVTLKWPCHWSLNKWPQI
jgi:hypothetical protein